MTTTTHEAISLRVSKLVPAPIERVYAAWTNPELFKQWMGPRDEFTTEVCALDARVGGAYKIIMTGADGQPHCAAGIYKEVSPTKLVFTWDWEGKDDERTLVTVELRDQGNSTEVILTHEGFEDGETRDDHAEGWTGCLERLARFCRQ